MFHVEHSKNANDMKATANKIAHLHPLMWHVVFLGVSSVVLFAVAIAIPPEGEVHASVLKGLAIITVDIALTIFAYAVISGKTATFEHGKTRATVGGKSPSDSEPDN